MNIHPAELYEAIDSYVLVDVRSSSEYESGHIEGAALVTLGDELIEFLEDRKSDPEIPFVFICRVGRRSAQACCIAREYGFYRAQNLEGGVMKWAHTGLPLV